MFRFDWEDVEGRPLGLVLGRAEVIRSDGQPCWEALALVLDDGRAILLGVNDDTDEIFVDLASTRPEGENWSPAETFAEMLGQPLGWCWEGRNYRGYLDSFLLAFGDVVPAVVEPRLLFIAAASTISCERIGKMAQSLP